MSSTISMILLVVSVNSACNYMNITDDCTVASKTIYDGTPGNCDKTSFQIEYLALNICIPIIGQTEDSSKFMECVNGYYVRNKVFSTFDCSGDYVTSYDGLNEDACYEISCNSISCSCVNPPCDYKCTSRKDATCSFDCCDAIWTDPDGNEICSSNAYIMSIFYATIIVMTSVLY
eukprot:124784_1